MVSSTMPGSKRGFACSAAGALVLVGFLGCGKPEPPQAPQSVAVPPPEPPSVLSLAPVPPILVRGVGFESPKAVLYDAAADVYLVSNVEGGLADADGKGFISRLAPDGSLLELEWIGKEAAGSVLDAPKGMALVGDKLYVADINKVRSFDRQTGKATGQVVINGATFLNDVAAAPDGKLYVSDSGFGQIKGLADPQKNGGDAVYVIDGAGAVSALAKGAELGQPTGLLADGAGVWVATLGGELYHLSLQGQRESAFRLPGSGLEGLVQTASGRWVVASRETSTVYIAVPSPAPQAAPFEPLITDVGAPGDLGYDPKRRQLLVPLFKENAVYIQQIPASAG
jgi:DNA-binding beta-propeller fold protein YncE